MRYLFTILCCLLTGTAFAQQKSLGVFENHTDVGNPKKAGSAEYDKAAQIYTLKGAGYNIWFRKG